MNYPEINANPTKDQLFQLASIGICLAKDQGKFKESKKAENAHIFLAEDLESVEVHSEEEYRTNSHKFIGRIGRIGYKHWSMRLAEPYWVSTKDNNDGFRATYKFEWTDKDVIMALKKMHAKHAPEDIIVNPDILLEVVEDELFMPDFVHAVNQFEAVSAADCTNLIRDMQTFSNASRYVMHYNR